MRDSYVDRLNGKTVKVKATGINEVGGTLVNPCFSGLEP